MEEKNDNIEVKIESDKGKDPYNIGCLVMAIAFCLLIATCHYVNKH